MICSIPPPLRGSDFSLHSAPDGAPEREQIRASERGFTMVEVVVAIFVLLVGVLGVLTLTDGANRTTSVTKGREAATNIARSVLETARTLPYSSLETGSIATVTQQQPGLGDGDPAAGWQIIRRNTTYTVTLTACSVDDPADGIGTDDASTFCSVGTPSTPPDSKPADYKRVSTTIAWQGSDHKPRSTTQSTVVSGSYRGPSVLTLNGPSGTITSLADPGSAGFSITATAGADHVDWFLDGNDQGAVSGCGTSCTLNWNLGKPTGSAPCDPNGSGVLDGTYIISATAYDGDGLTDNSRAVTQLLNRCPPLPPSGFEGGETFLFPGVELQWDQSPEEDVVGYYVWTAPAATGPWTLVVPALNPDPTIPDCSGLVKTANCVDDDTPTTSTKVWYSLQAVDKDTNGNLRAGDRGPALLVDPKNSRPGKPGGFGIDNAFPFSIKFDGPNVSDPPPADYVDFFYIYRDDMSGRADRYDSLDNTGGHLTWTDPDDGGVAHDYWVVAVDNHLAESAPQPDYFHHPTPTAVHCDAAGTCQVMNLP